MRIIKIIKKFVLLYINRLIDGEEYEKDFDRNYSKYSSYYRKFKI